ncbi:MAG TPA: DUF1254 domain-containing protein [Rhizobiaceae bacterium]|nr:DUF1254 domain-containing protein [Rhizobiaceae bacterium]
MGRILHAGLLGLLGAAIVHIAVLLLLPAITEKDAWSRLADVRGLFALVPISGQQGEERLLRLTDPYFEAAACRFDLTEGLARVHASGRIPYWSISIYDRSGQNIYSFNDRSTASGDLDLLVLSPVQMMELRKNLPGQFEQSVFVETPVEEGMVVVRGFAPDPSWKPTVAAYVKSVTCTAE